MREAVRFRDSGQQPPLVANAPLALWHFEPKVATAAVALRDALAFRWHFLHRAGGVRRRTFTTRPIPPATSSEVLLAISFDDRNAVDAINAAAAAHGGTADINPLQDHGFMYSRALADLDGHVWEAFWMDPAAIPSGEPAA